MMNVLANKVAVVTGASTGIGYATAKLFAEEGAAVIVAARRQKELDELVHAICSQGGSVVALAGDVKHAGGWWSINQPRIGIDNDV